MVSKSLPRFHRLHINIWMKDSTKAQPEMPSWCGAGERHVTPKPEQQDLNMDNAGQLLASSSHPTASTGTSSSERGAAWYDSLAQSHSARDPVLRLSSDRGGKR